MEIPTQNQYDDFGKQADDLSFSTEKLITYNSDFLNS